MMRAPVAEDLGQLIEMGRAFFVEAGHENSHPGFEFCPVSFGKTLHLLASNGALLVADRGDGPIGMAAIDVAPALWNHKVILGREAFFYMMPDARKGFGRKIIAAMETAARSYGASVFDLVVEPGPRSLPLAELYRRKGYNPAETTFRKRLTGGL